jgi:N-acetylglucosamine kinase-like BadF-type ATPase
MRNRLHTKCARASSSLGMPVGDRWDAGCASDSSTLPYSLSSRRGPATRLTDDFFELFRVGDVRSVFRNLYESGAAATRIARLAALVTVAAEQQDEVALQILGGAAAYLASIAAVIAQRLGLTDRPCPLGLAGGVLMCSPIMRALLSKHLGHRGITTGQAVLVETPALGALQLARGSLKRAAQGFSP